MRYEYVNATLFGGTLTRPAIELTELEEFGNFTPGRIQIRNGLEPSLALGTLVHEMIHQHQHDCGLPVGHDWYFRVCKDALHVDMNNLEI
jgi:hypothetical protein